MSVDYDTLLKSGNPIKRANMDKAKKELGKAKKELNNIINAKVEKKVAKILKPKGQAGRPRKDGKPITARVRHIPQDTNDDTSQTEITSDTEAIIDDESDGEQQIIIKNVPKPDRAMMREIERLNRRMNRLMNDQKLTLKYQAQAPPPVQPQAPQPIHIHTTPQAPERYFTETKAIYDKIKF